MHLEIKNVGIIKSARIDVQAVTVIAGVNSTGKSTIGKVLYALVTSLAESTPYKLFIEKISSVNIELRQLVRVSINEEIRSFVDQLFEITERSSYEASFLDDKSINQDEIRYMDSNFAKEILNLIYSIKNISSDNENSYIDRTLEVQLNSLEEIVSSSIFDKKLGYTVLQNVFDSEFNNQIRNLTNKESQSNIRFSEVNNNEVELIFKDNKIMVSESRINLNRQFTRPIYIDNPLILDEFTENGRHVLFQSKMKYNHKMYLYKVLRNADKEYNIFFQEKNDLLISEILKQVIKGDLRIDGKKSYYQLDSTDDNERLSLLNLSTGMKSFSILAILKNSGIFQNTEYVILDEPEIHLHPEWQLKYAELIILISKYLNIKFLITSHSPYFVEAVELYSKKHKMDSEVNYYKSLQDGQNSNYCELIECTENLDLIYDELANSLYTLEELREEIEGDEN